MEQVPVRCPFLPAISSSVISPFLFDPRATASSSEMERMEARWNNPGSTHPPKLFRLRLRSQLAMSIVTLYSTEDAHYSNSSQNMVLARMVVIAFRSILIATHFQWTSHWMDAGRSCRAGGKREGIRACFSVHSTLYSTSVWSISQITMEENSLSIMVPIDSAIACTE